MPLPLASLVQRQVPLLAERRQRVRNLFEARGIERFDTQADEDACVEALADERLRAAFEAAFKLFTMSMEIVLPRPEALPFVPDAKAFGAIAFAARRRYRDEAVFDASLYGSKVRRLIDDHVEAFGIEQKIPPISITAADFDTKVADLHSDRAKASERRSGITCVSTGMRTPSTTAGCPSGWKKSSTISVSSGSSSPWPWVICCLRSGPVGRPTTAG
jgi:type I restriction enzyme, R subunit